MSKRMTESQVVAILKEVVDLTNSWITLYNEERPHDSLNDMTPVQYKFAA